MQLSPSVTNKILSSQQTYTNASPPTLLPPSIALQHPGRRRGEEPQMPNTHNKNGDAHTALTIYPTIYQLKPLSKTLPLHHRQKPTPRPHRTPQIPHHHHDPTSHLNPQTPLPHSPITLSTQQLTTLIPPTRPIPPTPNLQTLHPHTITNHTPSHTSLTP